MAFARFLQICWHCKEDTDPKIAKFVSIETERELLLLFWIYLILYLIKIKRSFKSVPCVHLLLESIQFTLNTWVVSSESCRKWGHQLWTASYILSSWCFVWWTLKYKTNRRMRVQNFFVTCNSFPFDAPPIVDDHKGSSWPVVEDSTNYPFLASAQTNYLMHQRPPPSSPRSPSTLSPPPTHITIVTTKMHHHQRRPPLPPSPLSPLPPSPSPK